MNRRPWYRIHFSTFIVTLVVASVLAWLNLRIRDAGGMGTREMVLFRGYYGFPLTAVNAKWQAHFQFQGPFPPENATYTWNAWAIVGNVLVAAITLLLLGGLAEYLKRRRGRLLGPIHLATVVVLVMVSGSLLGINLHYLQKTPIENDSGIFHYDVGWPFFLQSVWKENGEMTGAATLDYDSMLFLNIGFAVFVILGSTLLCEWFVRKRSRKISERQT